MKNENKVAYYKGVSYEYGKKEIIKSQTVQVEGGSVFLYDNSLLWRDIEEGTLCRESVLKYASGDFVCENDIIKVIGLNEEFEAIIKVSELGEWLIDYFPCL